MEYQEHYEGMIERNTICKDYESRGLRMLHDNFDSPKWKRGDPIIGTMIFTDEPGPITPIEPVRDLAAELTAQDERIKVLESKITKEAN